MKIRFFCPNCKAEVSKSKVGRKCPACGKTIKKNEVYFSITTLKEATK